MTKAKARGNGEGTIYQRGDTDKWVAVLTVGLDPDTGKPRRKYFYGDSEKEVKAQLIKERARLQDGTYVDDDGQTVAQFLTHWLEGVQPNVRPTTYAKYEQHVRIRIVPTIGKLNLSKLTPQQVHTMMLVKLNKNGTSAGTINDALTVLITALNQALKWNKVSRNVALLVDKPRQEKKETSYLSPEDARKFLEHVRGDRLEAFYTVAISLGLRRGEALGLKWEDVDFNKGLLTIRRQLIPIEGKAQFVEPKSKSSRRTINLPGVTLAALRKHRARQAKERESAGAKWQDTDLVFTTYTGTLIQPRLINRSFDAALAAAGIDHVRIHALRHTAASLLLAQGVDLKMISEILGHSRIGITMDLYSHLQDPARRDAASKMDQILGHKDDEEVA